MTVSPPALPVSPGQVDSAPGMADRSATGFVWMLAQTVGGRFLSMASQVVLARLLLPEHYGQVGLATTIVMAASFLINPGIEEVLVQRQRTLRRWSNAAFWMSLVCGVGGGLIMLLAAPIGAWIYGEAALVGLVGVSALGSALGAMAAVPTAILRVRFQFRILAGVGTLQAAVQAGLSMLLAWLGAGAYSFVIPLPVTMGLRLVLLWWIARPPILRGMQVHRWRRLLPDTLALLMTRMVGLAVSQGDYVVLGILTSPEVVGIYFFAFNLSRQLVQIFAVNMSNVLLPALSALQLEPHRQLHAALRTARMVALVTVPLCFLQAALADPLLLLFFGERWQPAVPVMQVLLVGTAINAPSWINANLLQAQGRYRLLFWNSLGTAIVFLLCISVGALQGEALGVAWASSLSLGFASLVNIWIAIRPLGGRIRDVLGIYLFPWSASLLTICLALLVVDFFPTVAVIAWARLLLASALAGLLYLATAFIFARTLWHELWGIGHGLLRRRMKSSAKTARPQTP